VPPIGRLMYFPLFLAAVALAQQQVPTDGQCDELSLRGQLCLHQQRVLGYSVGETRRTDTDHANLVPGLRIGLRRNQD